MERAPTTSQTLAASAARVRRLYELGAFARARALLDELPGHEPEAALARADFMLHVGEPAEALQGYRQAAADLQGSVHAQRGEAAALLNLERAAEALAAAERAQALVDAAWGDVSATERANVLTVLAGARGLMAVQGGMLDRLRHGVLVRPTFEDALAVEPANPYALTGLGRFHLQAPVGLGRDARRARDVLAQALAVAPHFYMTHAWYVRALEATGAWNEAARQRAVYAERYAAYPGALESLA